MNFPIISVIIPTYNRAHLVNRAIQSAFQQTVNDIEVIVVDDGSDDDTEQAVLSKWREMVRYYRQGNQGACVARNVGATLARGEYLAFLDSDDEWLPEKLEKQLAVFEANDDPDLGIVLCARKTIFPRYQRDRDRGEPVQGPAFDILIERRRMMGQTTSAFLVHRCVFDAGVRFDPDQPAMQDWDFLLTAARQFSIKTVPEVLLISHREDGGTHINSGQRRVKARLRALDKHYTDLLSRPWALARHHRGLAGAYLGVGDMVGMRRHLRAAQQLGPSRANAGWVLLSHLDSRSFMIVLRGTALANRALLLLRLPQIPHPFG